MGSPLIEDQTDAPSHPIRRKATLAFIRGGLVSLAVALLAGLSGVFFYYAPTAEFLEARGVAFQALRPIHTTFAAVWIFLGGVAMVHRYLEDHAGPPSNGERLRLRIQILLWLFAGVGVLATVAAGIFSGREYLGFHPAFSIPILLGWILFAWNFFSATWRGFWDRPVYVAMWGVSILFFIYTFVEQHAWLLAGVFEDPIVDLRLQWKATGTLVGSFNLLVYGSLYFIGEKLSGDRRLAHSKLAWALLGVGLLNSFTNFAHHTYHIPQSELVKWISFVVSMTEAIILTRVVWDIARAVSQRTTGGFDSTRHFLVSAKWWTGAMIASAILLSIPPLNTIIHGTQVVTAHAMGTEIGIDSMALFAGVCWMLGEIEVRRGRDGTALHTARARWSAIGLNVFAAILIVWLHFSGTVVGINRFQGLPAPDWLATSSPLVFIGAGIGVASCMTLLLARWLGLAFKPAS